MAMDLVAVTFQADIKAKVAAISKIEEGEKVLKILNIMSYFSSKNISTEIFIDLVGGTEELESTVELLKQYSLVNVLQLDPTILNISDLTQKGIRTILKKKNKEKTTLNTALKLFQTGLRPENLNHAVSTWYFASTYPELAAKFSMLPSNIVQMLGECCRYEEAYSFGKEQLKVLENLDYRSELYLRYKIGNVLLNQRKYEEALKIYEDSQNHYKDIKIFLRYAAEDGNLEATKFLIENKGIDDKIYCRKSLLHCAIQGNNFEVVRFLVEEKGVDINVANLFGITPIQFACEQGYFDIVKFLAEKGSNFNSVDNYRLTTVHHAVKEGNLGIVKFLIERGADFRSIDDDVKTPLHYAAEAGILDIAKFLVENGADFRSYDKYYKTPLHYAIEKNCFGLVKFLVEKGADVHSVDRDGKTSLHSAMCKGDLNIIRFLIKKGANVNAVDKNHMTPMDYGIEAFDPIEPIDYKGSTLLHYAVYYGNAQLVQSLLKCINHRQLHDFIIHRTKGGNSALDLAIKAGNKNIIKILDLALQDAPCTSTENISYM